MSMQDTSDTIMNPSQGLAHQQVAHKVKDLTTTPEL